ncbi:Type-2 restriction enzyme AplI [compost metagenome]
MNWPKDSKKPNAIMVSKKTKSSLWQHTGHYVITRRFSSKEEKRRIISTYYDSSLPGDFIGFENKLNVFHKNKKGLNSTIAKGLFVFLNSTLLDKYYRQFGGHTQVNASDLRSIHYPTTSSLKRIGEQVSNLTLSQKEIDKLIESEINSMAENSTENPLSSLNKIDQALEILKELGMPKQQLNERSALTFLALLNLHPDRSWQQIERPLIGVTPIMDWSKEIYGKAYAPNTRETFRRQTLHQFVDGGLVEYNPDDPKRAVNSPKACYQITSELFKVLLSYQTANWNSEISNFLNDRETLIKRYAMERDRNQTQIHVDDIEIVLSAGAHSQLIKDIIVEFRQIFAPGADLIYVGDTGSKTGYFKKERLLELGVSVDNHGKMPDVVLYYKEKNWLLLIESVTSHGPVDGKRHNELAKIFENSTAGLVYVTAFPDRKTMKKYFNDISWETEIWFADSPTHMMHLNGHRFLGPYL